MNLPVYIEFHALSLPMFNCRLIPLVFCSPSSFSKRFLARSKINRDLTISTAHTEAEFTTEMEFQLIFSFSAATAR